MKKLLLSLLPVLLWCVTTAQPPSYSAALIPEAIKKNASVIKRYENIYFEITDIDRATLKVQQAYTVMNEDGAGSLIFRNHSDKFNFLVDAEIKVFDAAGKQVNKYKKKDLSFIAISDGLIDDGKTAYLKIPASSYPITVEYLYEEKFKGSLFFPAYQIIVPGEGIQQSSFTAKVPKNLDLRYRESNIKLEPKITEDDKYKTYQWSVSNLPAIEYEEGAVSYESRYPRITLAATRFKMDDYEGDMSSWKNLGTWYYTMHKGLEELPEDRKAFLKDLVKDAKDDREKVKRVYDYLQKNFRYVSIQLGIGGWKSLPANFTDQKKYGDCKGLSNYMYAALKAVGIKSYPALINAQYNKAPLDPSFPMSGFNHVILCVPQAKDSIWLECTSKTTDFGVLGTFTENRNALLITEEGGVLVSTPASKPVDNRLDVTTVVSLQPDGSGKTVTSFNTTGEYKESMGYMIDEKKDDQKESIVYGLGFRQPDEFTLAKKGDTGPLTAELDMKLDKIPEFMAGNKMFISPRMYKLCGYKLPKAENRKYDFYFPNPYLKTDTTVLQLPDGFVVEALPKAKQLQCRHATYVTKYWYDESKKSIYSTTSLALNNLKIPVADYPEVKKFFEDVVLDDAQRIVIKKP
jgi:hypothetical protein